MVGENFAIYLSQLSKNAFKGCHCTHNDIVHKIFPKHDFFLKVKGGVDEDRYVMSFKRSDTTNSVILIDVTRTRNNKKIKKADL